MCLVLIQYGADVHLQDGDGDTPLMLAEGTDLKQAMMSKQTINITAVYCCGNLLGGEIILHIIGEEDMEYFQGYHCYHDICIKYLAPTICK